jgi:hypothetical protein
MRFVALALAAALMSACGDAEPVETCDDIEERSGVALCEIATTVPPPLPAGAKPNGTFPSGDASTTFPSAPPKAPADPE